MAKDMKGAVLPPTEPPVWWQPGWPWPPSGEGEPEVSDIGQAEIHAQNFKAQLDDFYATISAMRHQLNGLNAQLHAGAIADSADTRRVNNPTRAELERRRDDQHGAYLNWIAQLQQEGLAAFRDINAANLETSRLYNALSAQILSDNLADSRVSRERLGAQQVELVDAIGQKMEQFVNRIAQQQELAYREMAASLNALLGAYPPPGTVVRESISETEKTAGEK